MTEKEFSIKQKEILSRVPEQFQGWLAKYAWDEGHANGYSEVLIILGDLVHGFLQAWCEWRKDKVIYLHPNCK